MLRYLWLVVFDGTLSAKVNTISLLRAGCRHTRYGEFVLKDVNMNRLTKSKPLTEWEAMNLSLTDLYMRLKAYEDTGLEPEEINCVNTNVYVNWRDDVFNDSGTEQLTIDSVGFMTHDGTFYAFDEIGKTVFLTREDAEKALEGMKK